MTPDDDKPAKSCPITLLILCQGLSCDVTAEGTLSPDIFTSGLIPHHADDLNSCQTGRSGEV